MERFWVYLENKVQGPVEVPGLRKLNGFNLLTQVCPEGQESWRVADEVIEIKAYFSAPPRGSSLVPETQPDLPTEKSQMEMPLPMSSGAAASRIEASLIETLPDLPDPVAGNTVTQPATSADSLRLSCATCGYKNPRDVTQCMKCGSPLKSAGTPAETKLPITLSALPDTPAPMPVNAAAGIKMDPPMVEIPIARIATILASVALLGAAFFTVRHLWKAKHASAAAHVVAISVPPPSSKQYAPKSRMHGRTRRVSRARAVALPGVASSQSGIPTPRRHSRESGNPVQSTPLDPRVREGDGSGPASYTVVNEAYPLKHRTSSPVDSKYAVKRRGDHGLWSGREEEAIRMVQGRRIYGGQRTIQRNADILMQVLRDREYNTAFESGKRLYLFDDMDWAASPKDSPVFEVRLTFSGGKEADGSPREPLRFAFNVDLERQTVEAGGASTVKSNTMHAFFDESRIPPEERRTVAQDTEELVKAAQPGASPLALDTISKHYAATYSFPTLQRVADAFHLTIVNKKLEHETASLNDVLPETKPAATPEKDAMPAANQMKLIPSASGAIQYTMEHGEGKERRVSAQAPSRATPAKVWETMTSYDRMTQFVPDLLVSQREGQDGPAIIVHTISLTRLMFFVFKINLHLRILEHPQQHRLEFERIAGDFEKFSGYAEVTTDPTGTHSIINYHATLVPQGYLPDWVVRDMAQHFLVPVIDAFRSRAEAN